MHRSISVLCALAALALVPAASMAQSLEQFEQRVTEATLSNGLKVIIVEDHDAPVASFVNHVDVGAVNEVPGITGLAHMFEHMAFKGTHIIGTTDFEAERKAIARVDSLYHELDEARLEGDSDRVAELEQRFQEAQTEAQSYVESNEFGQIIEREGGQGLNAFTSSDATVYFFSLPANKAELWAYLESERFVHGVLREFYKERNVVMEERRRSTESQPIGRLIEQFIGTAYVAHPYGQPVVGLMSDLQTFTREDARAFMEKHYTPKNMIIAVVGDVDPERTIEILETYFGRLDEGPEPERIRTEEPRVPAEKVVTLYDPGQPWYVVGYPIPSIRHEDYPALMAISEIMAAGRTSRLHKRLVTEDKIAFFTGAFPGFPGSKYQTMMIFYATTARGHSNSEVAAAIDEEIAKFKTEPVGAAELERAKTKLRADLVRQLDSNFGLALQLTDYQAMTGDWRNLFHYIDRIEALSAEDLRQVANEYFDNRYRVVGKIETVESAATAGTEEDEE